MANNVLPGSPLLGNTNRTNKSDRNIFNDAQRAGGDGARANDHQLSPLKEAESEFVMMGELLQDSQEKQ